jgi:type I restriction enzyme R subunit
MQAIARVNRVFRDKPGGLIVDYIGIATNLKKALGDYTDSDRDQTGIDEEDAIAALQKHYEIVRGMFAGLDYSKGMNGAPRERLAALADAIEWISAAQQRKAARAANDEDRKRALRRYQDATLELSRAYALASASDFARAVRDEVGFFQAVRAVFAKTTGEGKLSERDRTFAVEQLINQAVASAEIVDILKAAGMKSPDISILSDDFLLEVQKMEKKNLALEALRRLLNGEIRSRAKTNVVEARKFSERLEDAVARYHTGMLSALEMIQALVDMAKDIAAAHRRGEESGLSPEEEAFYDALAENESAVEAMGDERLRLIAHELLEQLRKNITVDWRRKESARAKMRVLVRRILKKYGYPPDLEQAAVQTVLVQAELLLREVA